MSTRLRNNRDQRKYTDHRGRMGGAYRASLGIRGRRTKVKTASGGMPEEVKVLLQDKLSKRKKNDIWLTAVALAVAIGLAVVTVYLFRWWNSQPVGVWDFYSPGER